MMDKTPKLLNDIQDAVEFILSVTAGKSREDYDADRLLRHAVERNFEIISEAVERLARHDPALVSRISQHQQIIAFRNVLIHGYDVIDHERVWQVITDDLPALEEQVTELISHIDQPPVADD